MPPLVLVQTDGEYTLVRRRCRFDVDRELVFPVYTARFWQEVAAAQEEAISGLAQRGFIWVGPDWEISDPQPHIEFSDSDAADPGPRGMPDPRDLAAMQRWEQEEKARVARKLKVEAGGLVDFVIASTFKVKKPQFFRVMGGSPVWPKQ